jgi:hypothetical protein
MRSKLLLPNRNFSPQNASRKRRMQWWMDAKFGMFIHWGLYSIIGHQEWVLESEGVPIPQYEILAKHFKPKPNAAHEWARLAKAAGQKYLVLTTKYHEGFCLWDTKLTDYCAMQQGPGRDLVREFVEAARAEGLRVGFYYSLMDWHHPDGIKCATGAGARKRFVAYTHGLIRELMTNYGKIDILWYDVDDFWPSQSPAAEWLKFYQPATVVAIGGVRAKVLSAKVLKTGQKIDFTQSEISVRLTGLPENPPDDLVTVLELECDAPPLANHHLIRSEWSRYKVGISG